MLDMRMRVLTFAERLMKDFAEREEKIIAVYKGTDPEEGNDMYYFLAPGQHDCDLEDRLTDLDLRIFNELKVSVSVMIWPIPVEKAHEYCLKQRECIYVMEGYDE
jgi:hypothetical protein